MPALPTLASLRRRVDALEARRVGEPPGGMIFWADLFSSDPVALHRLATHPKWREIFDSIEKDSTDDLPP
jgi:hypothetical protein